MASPRSNNRTIRLTGKGEREVARLKADPTYQRAKARQIRTDRRRRAR
jgi:hypothetical protein